MASKIIPRFMIIPRLIFEEAQTKVCTRFNNNFDCYRGAIRIETNVNEERRKNLRFDQTTDFLFYHKCVTLDKLFRRNNINVYSYKVGRKFA